MSHDTIGHPGASEGLPALKGSHRVSVANPTTNNKARDAAR